MTSPKRKVRSYGAICVAAAMLTLMPALAHANFITLLREAGEVGHVARGVAKVGAMGSIEAGTFLRRLPHTPGVEARVITGTRETGFALSTLEGQPQVFSRVDDLAAALKTPPARGGKAELFVSEATFFEAQAAFRALPDLDNVRLVVKSGQSYPLQRTARGFAIEPQSNLRLNFSNASQFSEGYWRLNRNFNRSSLRLVVADDAATASLGAVRPNPLDRAITLERISATTPEQSLAGMRGQTVVVFGRIEDGAVIAPGGRGRLKLADLQAAATRADLDVIVLGTDAPGQSLLRRMIAGETPARIDIGARTETLAGLIGELGPRNTIFAVDATADGLRRTRIEAKPVAPNAATPTTATPPNDGGVMIHPPVHIVHAFTRTESEQLEHDARIFADVPSWIHLMLLFNLVAGLLAWQFSVAFFDRIWRKPDPSRPRSLRIARWLTFFLVFLPLTGMLCLMVAACMTTFFMVTAPFRWILRMHRPPQRGAT